MTQEDDDVDLLDRIHAIRRVSRRQRPYRYRGSKLDRHRHVIYTLHQRGASLTDIQLYLRALADPPVSADISTIHRFLKTIEKTAKKSEP